VGPNANYAKFPKIHTKGQTKYLRPNSQIFTIKTPSFQPCAEVFSAYLS